MLPKFFHEKGQVMRIGLLFFFSLVVMSMVATGTTRAERVTLTSGTHVYFQGENNHRERQFEAMLPASSEPFAQAILHFKLSCPDGLCDGWDRFGSFGMLDAQGRYFELMRFITPYGIGAEWAFDISPFLPLLQGKANFRVFIDTWVGPGHPKGNGWLVDASIQYIPGVLDQRPVHVLPLLSEANIVYGDPSQDTQRSGTLLPLIGYRSAKLVTSITGHGQGNAENCAEFCPKEHSLKVGDKVFSRRIWRDNCATTVDPNQKGNYFHSRAGWCPGDKVDPWIEDITGALASGSVNFTYNVELYDNTCRPGVTSCLGCTLGTGCEFDGGRHTEPRYYVSTYAVYYQ
ncbi:MAG TPA: peptide-N-glycosidase F-related protein [Oligoflexus sp.]|uniref:peptide-N-glycosidase F-related protein n=1 Tax=Oligoflexus sp. TaxID=1971216 RepID=UPI002D43230D|nr:peptide-N-glycosidase F-related protein [Oligoflexus sp.]HYX37550.1 peptide-N-glycosidase F-related protein [Oligoflexus sp.]